MIANVSEGESGRSLRNTDTHLSKYMASQLKS
jgi:hypothetical protein